MGAPRKGDRYLVTTSPSPPQLSFGPDLPPHTHQKSAVNYSDVI